MRRYRISFVELSCNRHGLPMCKCLIRRRSHRVYDGGLYDRGDHW
jgi:hypothetical protein